MGILFVNKFTFLYDFRKVVKFSRISYEILLEIISVNPLITNVIFFQKYDYIFLYSDCSLTISGINTMNPNIAVFNSSTG